MTSSLREWRGKVAQAAEVFGSRWTIYELEEADPELALRVREQIDLFDEMCVIGTNDEIAAHGAAMVRGFTAATAAMRKQQRKAVTKPPDLQALVAEHGGYGNISAEAWSRWDADMRRWQAMVRNGGLHD